MVVQDLTTQYIAEFSQWISQYESWFVQALIALLVVISVHICTRLVLRRLGGRMQHNRRIWGESLLHAIRLPLQIIIWIIGLMWMADIAHLETNAVIFRKITRLHELLIMATLSWTVIRFISRWESLFLSLGPMNVPSRVDPTLAMAISKLIRVVVFIATGLMILQTLGYSLSGLLAFGGVGGVAVGFASKDLLANFFGGVMISMDRPFRVGDWVSAPEKQIEGTVEYIGWRLTRIRTFDKRPLYVPNSLFANISVVNPSRMLNRRIKQVIGLRYCDSEIMPNILADMRSFLASHPEIDDNQLCMVNFVSFGESTLNIQVYCFTRTCDWAKYLLAQEDVLLNIVRIVHEHGGDIAFPTTTLELPGSAVSGMGSAEEMGHDSPKQSIVAKILARSH